MKVLFLGTGEFAIPALSRLFTMPAVELVGVVTQPDKPVGRKQALEGGPVKQWLLASEHANTPIFQPEKLRTAAEAILAATIPDIVIVAAYGQIIPDVMLEQPQFKALNIHGSLLPQLRGAVPVQMAILQGLEQTGVTIQRVVAELDAGPILAAQTEPISPHDTTGSLMARLANAGADLLGEVLPGWVDGTLEAQEQDHTRATFCYQNDIAKDKAQILATTSVITAERMIRAFNPWPVAWTEILVRGELKRLKIYAAQVHSRTAQEVAQPHLVRADNSLVLQLGDGELVLGEIQLEGKQRASATEYFYLVP